MIIICASLACDGGSDASHVWAKVYDAVLADVFDVQSSIAAQVADTLRVALLVPERKALAVKPTANLRAYDYYLRGKDYDSRRYEEKNALLAVRMYQRAAQLDPKFARAYARLARAKVFLSGNYGLTEELAGAKQAIERAEELGPDLTETHLALGWYYYYGRFDFAHALEQFAWVRERTPNDPDVLHASGLIHRRLGPWSEAVRDLTRALDLVPERVTPPGFAPIATITAPVNPVATRPEASRAVTCTAGVMGAPTPSVLVGCTVNDSLERRTRGRADRYRPVLANLIRLARPVDRAVRGLG